MISYLDAGTGSMIVTAIAGGVAGIGVAFKMGIGRIKAKFGGSSDSDSDNSSDDSASDSSK